MNEGSVKFTKSFFSQEGQFIVALEIKLEHF
jgi:hypothetical protein